MFHFISLNIQHKRSRRRKKEGKDNINKQQQITINCNASFCFERDSFKAACGVSKKKKKILMQNMRCSQSFSIFKKHIISTWLLDCAREILFEIKEFLKIYKLWQNHVLVKDVLEESTTKLGVVLRIRNAKNFCRQCPFSVS